MADVETERRPDYFLAGSRPLARLEVHERVAAFAPLALRLCSGVTMLAHGVQKWAAMAPTAGAFETMGFAPGYLWAPVAGAIELLGGIALILGLLTRPAALLLLAEQLVALLVVHLPHGFFLKPTGPDGFEYNLVLVGTFLALVFLGSGKIGLDEEIRRKKGRTVYRERRVAPPEAPRPPPGAAP